MNPLDWLVLLTVLLLLLVGAKDFALAIVLAVMLWIVALQFGVAL